MLKKLEKPDISDIDINADHLEREAEKVIELIKKSFSPYVYWDTVKRWPTPNGVTNKEVWAIIKSVRKSLPFRKESGVRDEAGCPFMWASYLPNLEQFLHSVDMRLGGNLFLSSSQTSDELKHRLLVRGIMEEAIASSQMEGAHTTRKAAKQILLEKRKARNTSEQMIINNYQAMTLIETELKNKKLDEETLLSLHVVLTQDTLPDHSGVGRYRKNEDNIVVGDDGVKNEIYHIPPKEEFVKKEIKRFIAYANNELNANEFVHPVIKAIIIHFWIGYLHPFIDGNGRMARALFYWYLLREKYWAFGYIPLSKVIKSSPAQYRDAYIYSEQDDNDLTYFIDYNIKKISQATKEFDEYTERKGRENRKMAKIAHGKYQLNERQTQLLRYYYKNNDVTTSISTHMKVNETSRITAMKDLKDLEKKGFITSKKVGRNVYYYATEKVSSLFD